MDDLSNLPLGTRLAELTHRRSLEQHLAHTPFLFVSPRQTLMSWSAGPAIRATTQDGAQIQAALRAAIDGGISNPYVVGACPFLDGAATHLWITGDCLRHPGPLTVQARQPVRGHPLAMTDRPATSRYTAAVSAALQRIAAGELSKVVLARSLDLHWSEPLDLEALLTRLVNVNPHGYTFAVELADPTGSAPRRLLVGSSPELLVARQGMQVHANPLAGSAPRSPDPRQDRQRAEALLRSAKDLHEHALVIDAVAEALRPYCRDLKVPAAPSLVKTPRLWHLSTEVSGTLDDPNHTAYDLARALHPTPAVCGHPAVAARALIGELEPFDRDLFTGMVGWCDSRGDGEWAVTIRCAEVAGDRLRLFAGAGIVAGSDPEQELAETTTKLQTLLDVLGIRSEVAL